MEPECTMTSNKKPPGFLIAATISCCFIILIATFSSASPPDAAEFNMPKGRFDVSSLHAARFHGPIALGGYLVEIDRVTGAVSVIDRVAPPPAALVAASDREPDWDSLGAGVDGFVFDMVLYGGDLVVAGNFLQAGGAPAAHIALWDGSAWSPLGAGTDDAVLGLTVWDGKLIALGLFENAGGGGASRVAAWDWATWSALGGGLTSGGAAVALSGGTYGGALVVSGQFDHAGGVPAENIASWNGLVWAPLGGGLNDIGNTMVEYGGALVVGGVFSSAGGLAAANVARWNGAAWAPLGAGVNGEVWDADIFDGELVLAGQFTLAGAVPAERIAAWDGLSWSALAGGLNNAVFAIAAYDTALIAGGSFNEADGLAVGQIATWDGIAWDSLGFGVNSSVFALLASDTTLIAGGSFTQADGKDAGFVAQWRCELPATPTGIVATTTLCDRITVTWNDVPVETGYEIWRDGGWEGAVGADITSYDDLTVPTGTASYTVKAINVCGASLPTSAVVGERHELPVQPATVAASDANCAGIRVDWAASTYATSYRVYRDGSLIATVAAPALFYEDTPAPGTYDYAVSAVNICGWADSTFDEGTRPPGVPLAPATVTASVDKCAYVRLDWSAVANAQSYILYRGGTHVATVVPSQLHFNVTSPPGDHIFGVAAKNTCGQSDSTTATGTVLPAPPPPPSTLSASDSSCNLVRLDWSAVAGVTNYRLYRNGSQIAAPAPGVLSHDDSPPAGSYSYSIASENSCGSVGTTGATGVRLAVPAAPSSFVASDTSCSLVRLDWSAPAFTDSFHLFRDAVLIETLPASTLFHEEALPAGTYGYTISAFNNCGESTETGDNGTVLPPPPAAPASFTASDDSCNRVRLDWPASPGAALYRIYRGGALIAEVGGGTLTYDDMPAPGTYPYGVAAANSCGESIAAEDTGTLLDALPPPVASVTASDTSCALVRIDWSASPGTDEYRVTRDAVVIALVPAPTLHYEDVSTPGAHQYGVAAGSDCGYSSPRYAGGSLLPGRPDAPPGVTADDSACLAARIDWSVAADADEYRVYRDGVEIATTTALYYEDPAPAGDYTYGITASNECGESDPSAKTVHLSEIAAAPGSVAASDSSCAVVRIDWDGVAGAENYRVFRDGAVVATIPAPATNYSDPSTAGAHTYGVATGSGCGWSDATETTGTLLPGRADPPAGAVASDSSCAVIRLDWNASADADSYYIGRDGLIVKRLPAGQLAWVDAGASGAHRYTVGAANECGVASSSRFDGSLLAIPEAPLLFTASDTSCALIRLSWVDSSGASSYRISRGNSVIATVDSGVVTYADSADPGTFEYAVESGNKCGWSAPAGAQGTRLPGRPAEPPGFTASDSLCTEVQLRWSESAGAEMYRLFRDGNLIAELSAAERNYDDGGAAGSHDYRVEAVNSCGASVPATGTGSLLAAAPGPLASFDIVDTLCSAVRLVWGESERADSVHISRDGEPLASFPMDGGEFETTETPGGHTYNIHASNSCGLSAPREGSATIEGRPAPPEAFTASDTSCRAIYIQWNGPPDAERYELYRDGLPIALLPADLTSYVDRAQSPAGNDLPPLSYELFAFNRCGPSDTLRTDGRLLPGRALPPDFLTASDTSCSIAHLEWGGVALADSFHVYRNGVMIAALGASDTEWDDRWSSGTYAYAVASYNGCGRSDSNVAPGTILPGTPAMPGDFALTDDRCDSVIATWTHDEEYLLGFTVYREGEAIAALGPEVRRFADDPAPGDSEYRLLALGECAASPPALAVGAVADTAGRPDLLAPGDGAVIYREDPAVLEWSAQPGAVGYRIQLAADAPFEQIRIDTLLSGPVTSANMGAVESIGENPTYWRVAAIFTCADDRFSPSRSYTHVAEPLLTSFSLSRRDVEFAHDPLNEIAGGEVPDPQPAAIVLRNTGNSPIDWRCVPTEDWVAVDPDHSRLDPGGEDTIRVGAKPGALRGGSYLAQVVVETEGDAGPRDTIAVELTVRHYRAGDVDGNDLLDLLDLTAVIEHVLETTPIRPSVMRAGLADLNDDGAIDVSDLVGLARGITREALAHPTQPDISRGAAPLLLSIREGDLPGAATLALSGEFPVRSALFHFRSDLQFEAWSASPASDRWHIVRRQTGNSMVLLLYSLDASPPHVDHGSGVDVALLSWSEAQADPFYYAGGSAASSPASMHAIEVIGGNREELSETGFYLAQTRPTPFRHGTIVEFNLPAATAVKLSVFSPAGRRVRLLLDERVGAGMHHVAWDGRDAAGRQLPPGIYFIRLDGAGEMRTRRTVLLR